MPTSETSPMRTLCVVSALLLLLPIVSMAQGVWKHVGNIYGEDVSSLLQYNGDTLMCATAHGGVHRSPDGGSTWDCLSLSGLDSPTTQLVRHRQSLYAVSKSRLRRSEDGGVTWDGVSLTEVGDCNAILADDSTLWIAGSNGLFISTDEARTFTKRSVGLTRGSVSYVFKHDTVMLAGVHHDVCRSTDQGESWHPVGIALPWVGSIAAINDAMFIATSRYLYRSTDSGVNWEMIANEGANHLISLDSILLVAKGTGLYSVTSRDTELRAVDTGDAATSVTTSLRANGELFLGTTCGVYRTGTDDIELQHSSEGLSYATAYGFFETNAAMYARTESGMCRSSDGGQTWTWTNDGLSPLPNTGSNAVNTLASFGTDTLVTLCGSSYSTGGSMYRSTDNGTTWLQVTFPERSNHVTCITKHQSMLIAAVDSLIYLSTDRGATWTPSLLNVPDTLEVGAITSNGSNLIAVLRDRRATGKERLIWSRDNGVTWTMIDQALYRNYDIVSIDSVFLMMKSDTTYRSIDGGATWERLSAPAPLPFMFWEHSSVVRGQELYVLEGWWSVYRSSDYASSWTKIDSGLPSSNHTLAQIGRRLYTCERWGAVYVYDEDATSVDDATRHPDATSSAYSISVHPVPARDRIILTYRTEASEYVRIAVVGSNGEVVHHHNAHPLEGGEHTLDINTSTWASGVYSITVQTHRRTHSTPVMVVR